MKQNKAVFMTFATDSSTATANINIPFQVRTIHVKSAALITSTPPSTGEASYLFVVSDLTQNSPLCIVYQDSTYPYSTAEDLVYEFQNPQPINGTFTFQLLSFTGVPNIATAGGDQLGLILEFSSDLDHD
jgi:hypothetical protein